MKKKEERRGERLEVRRENRKGEEDTKKAMERS